MKKILIFAHDLFEDMELFYPFFRLQEAEYIPVVVAKEEKKEYKGKYGYPVKSELSFDKVNPSEYRALIIPGGFAPDKIRQEEKALEIVKKINDERKPIGFICHGGWVPISANILKGKSVTGYIGIKDDLTNAGAHFKDEEAVVDGHLISSRTPKDLPAFMTAFLQQLT